MAETLTRLAVRSSAEGSRVGILPASGGFVDADSLARRYGQERPGLVGLQRHRTLDTLIDSGDWPVVVAALDGLDVSDVSAESVSDLLPPIARPSKIIGIGMNLPGLVGGAVPQLDEIPSFAPFWFMKAPSALTGHGHPIIHPGEWHTRKLIPEPEMGLVIGRRCGPGIATPRGEECREYVAGFTIVNDVSALDLEFERGGPPFAFNLSWSKSYPSFAPMGPGLLPMSRSLDPAAFDVVMQVNGEEVVRASTSQMLWSAWELVEYFAAVLILEPGDVISCGNYPPVRHIWPGDQVTIKVGPIGELVNTVVPADPETRFRVPERVTADASRHRQEQVAAASVAPGE